MTAKKRVLITGLNGLVGWHMFLAMHKLPFVILGTYRRAHASFDQPDCVPADVEQRKTIRLLLELFRPTHVLHASCMCDLDVCEREPELTARINVQGTALLLEEIARLGTVQHFSYVSTDHVFDGERGGYTEADRPNPKHVFGRTKWAAEQMVMHGSMPWMIVRPGLVIGESVQGNKGPRDWLYTRLRLGKPSHLFVDEWRTPIRAERLAREVSDLLRREARGIFHVAGCERLSRYELAHVLAEAEGLPAGQILPRFRRDDRWGHIRPKDLSLRSRFFTPPSEHYFL